MGQLRVLRGNPSEGWTGKGSREGLKVPQRERQGGSSGYPSTLLPPAGALPFGRSIVWEKEAQRERQPGREMGGTTA